jgi:hypothetical protein
MTQTVSSRRGILVTITNLKKKRLPSSQTLFDTGLRISGFLDVRIPQDNLFLSEERKVEEGCGHREKHRPGIIQRRIDIFPSDQR